MLMAPFARPGATIKLQPPKGSMTLSWTGRTSFYGVDIELRAEGIQGWMAVGISSDGKMPGSHAVVATWEDGVVGRARRYRLGTHATC